MDVRGPLKLMTPRQIAETPGSYPTATLCEAAGKRGDRSPDSWPSNLERGLSKPRAGGPVVA